MEKKTARWRRAALGNKKYIGERAFLYSNSGEIASDFDFADLSQRKLRAKLRKFSGTGFRSDFRSARASLKRRRRVTLPRFSLAARVGVAGDLRRIRRSARSRYRSWRRPL
jgi:hypothetical protein